MVTLLLALNQANSQNAPEALPVLPGLTPIAPTPGISSSPAELPAYEVVELLCARNITAVEYVEALLEKYEEGGYECLNIFITLNVTRVRQHSQ